MVMDECIYIRGGQGRVWEFFLFKNLNCTIFSVKELVLLEFVFIISSGLK